MFQWCDSPFQDSSSVASECFCLEGAPSNQTGLLLQTPIASMYGLFTYIYHKCKPNVGKFSIHGWYGTQKMSIGESRAKDGPGGWKLCAPTGAQRQSLPRQRRDNLEKGGPERARDSRIKFPCYYKHCRRGKDVKNVGKTLRLPKEEANLEERKTVRATCHVLRICCQKHRAKCKKQRLNAIWTPTVSG